MNGSIDGVIDDAILGDIVGSTDGFKVGLVGIREGLLDGPVGLTLGSLVGSNEGMKLGDDVVDWILGIIVTTKVGIIDCEKLGLILLTNGGLFDFNDGEDVCIAEGKLDVGLVGITEGAIEFSLGINVGTVEAVNVGLYDGFVVETADGVNEFGILET